MKYRTDKIHALDTLIPVLEQCRAKGERIVFTNGCFDLLHVGHIRYLNSARKLGDRLVIAVNTDSTVSDLKGPNRPVNSADERIEVLAAFEFTDFVFEFFEPTPLQIIQKILPDILAKGADWPKDQIVGREVVEQNGGKVVRVEMVKGKSTSNTIDSISKHHT